MKRQSQTLFFILILVSCFLISEFSVYADSISVEQMLYQKLKDKDKLGTIYKDKFGSSMPSNMSSSVEKIVNPIHGITQYKTEEYPTQPILVVKNSVTNCDDKPITSHVTVDQTTEISSTWQVDTTLSIGSEVTVEGKVPFEAEVSESVSTEFSISKSNSQTKTKTLTWSEGTDVDVDPYTRVLTQFIVSGKESQNIPFWVDFNVSGPVEMKFFYDKGTMTFHADNGGHGDLLGKYYDDKNRKMNLKNCCMKNDEIRSMKFFNVVPGTVVKVYDSPDASTSDDYCEIKIKKLKSEIIVSTFEKDYSDDYISVDFHHHNGLDGKISYINIETVNHSKTTTITIDDYLSADDRKIHITGVWKGSGTINGDWYFSKDPNFTQGDCQNNEGSDGGTTHTIHNPNKVEPLPGKQIKHIEVKPK